MNKLAHLFLTAFTIAILTMLAAIAWSQPKTTGIITVRITNAKTKEPLPGCAVQLIGTKQGAMTKTHGLGTIVNVRPGTYSLRLSYIGYFVDSITNVIVHADSTVTVSAKLREKPFDSTTVITLPITPQPKVIRDYQRIAFGDSLSRLALTVDHTHGGFSIRGGRASDSIVDTRDPPVEDIVQAQWIDSMTSTFSGNGGFTIRGTRSPSPQSNFQGIEINTADTTSRVYRVYYKR